MNRYRSPAVLTMNPVTTFGAAYRNSHPRVPAPKALRRIKRYLEIPAFHDVLIDLRRSDRYFDGETLLARLDGRRMSGLVRGNIARLDRIGVDGSNSIDVPRGRQLEPQGSDDVPGFASFASSVIDGIEGGAGGQIGSVDMGAVIDTRDRRHRQRPVRRGREAADPDRGPASLSWRRASRTSRRRSRRGRTASSRATMYAGPRRDRTASRTAAPIRRRCSRTTSVPLSKVRAQPDRAEDPADLRIAS